MNAARSNSPAVQVSDARGRTPLQRARWERDQQILAARTLGRPVASIAFEHGLTKQAVQQILARRHGPTSRQVRGVANAHRESDEQKRREQIDAWLRHHPGSTISEIADGTGMSISVVHRQLKQLRHRALIARPVAAQNRYADEELLAGLRWVATVTGGTASLPDYRRLRRERGLPAENTLISRFGSWSDACRLAGVVTSPRRGGPSRRWTAEKLMGLVGAYLDEPMASGTWSDFQSWLNARSIRVSQSLFMMRLGRWSAAKRLVMSEANPDATEAGTVTVPAPRTRSFGKT